MSVHVISYNKDGAKMMRPVLTETEYRNLRNSPKQKSVMKAIRSGDVSQKSKLLQMNYSCLPNEDGSLKGTKTMSTTVGMDVDHIAPEELEAVKERILGKKDELGLLMLELSARGMGYHLVFKRRAELSQEENLKWASELLGVAYDEGAKDITRVFFTTTNSELFYLDPEIFEIKEAENVKIEKLKNVKHTPSPLRGNALRASLGEINLPSSQALPHSAMPPILGEELGSILGEEPGEKPKATSLAAFDLCAEQAGLKLGAMDVWGEHNWHTNLMAVLSVGVAKLMSRQQLKAVVAERLPNYSQTEDCQKLIDYFYEKYDADKGFMNASLREINAKAQKKSLPIEEEPEGTTLPIEGESEGSSFSTLTLPQGYRESVEAVDPSMMMTALIGISPSVGALATGVTLDVHGQKRNLNLIAYVAGDFASNKGELDPVVEAWMSEVMALDAMYLQQEEEFRAKKLAAKNKKEQPEEPKLPVRCLTLNNTVANLAERLANTGGKHAFSFTPEADTVAQKWKSAMSDFSIMLRQSYDGSRYDREARSVEAVNVHIGKLLWNVTMCGTPDALYRVVNNYTDGFQSRIAIARTPDNTFSPLEEKPRVLTERQRERIQQVAHLLPLMQGEVVLTKLEAKGREWVEGIRLETMKNDDRIKARQRFRVCVTAQRMTCCIMLCKVCETLIKKHGLAGAEARLKQYPNLWKEMIQKTQTPQMLAIYDVVADTLLENALYYFRDRIEAAFNSRDYMGCSERQKRGKNDSIYERLDGQFTTEQAMQQSIAVKGANVTPNTIRQMLKNWRKQGLIIQIDGGVFRKK